MTCNSCKANWWCNNHNHKYIVGKLLSIFAYNIISQYINYWLMSLCTSIIVTRKTHLFAALCIYIVVIAIYFLPKAIVRKLVFLHFQTKVWIAICMHMWTCCTHTMMTDISKTVNIWAHFFYNTYYWQTYSSL